MATNLLKITLIQIGDKQENNMETKLSKEDEWDLEEKTNSPLVEIVNNSGLEKTKADIILTKFQDYFQIASEWEKKAKTIVVTKESQTADMKMARIGRLELREKRIAIESARKELKEQSVREGKAIDGIANVLKALIVPIEEYLEQQEKYIEIQAEKKAEAERIEVERKAEEDRIAKEKAEAEERERIRLENERLKKEAEAKEKSLEQERAKVAAEKAEAERKAKAEQDRLKKEAEAKLEAERKKQEAILNEQRKELERKRKEADAKAKDEQEKVKKEAEAKAKIERERIEKENKEKMAKMKAEMEAKHKAELEEKKNQEKIIQKASAKKWALKFEDFLHEYYSEEVNPTCLDDNLPDATSDWLGDLDVDEVIKLAGIFIAKKIGV